MDSDEDEDTVLVGTQYVDMINDHARNEAYRFLCVSIDPKMVTKAQPRKTLASVVKTGDHVLDIGTGTGLLAMFAVEAGAAHVTACEVYKVRLISSFQ